MRSIVAALVRLAAPLPEDSPFRPLFASLIRSANANYDKILRAMFVEGAMGHAPNSIASNPDPYFKPAIEALRSGEDNRLIEKLRYDLGMDDREIAKLLGNKDTGIYAACVKGAAAGMGGHSSLRGLMADGIVTSVVAGISPVTLKAFDKYGAGQGLFQWLGSRAPKGTTIRGIASVASKDVKNRAMDILRKTRKEEQWMSSIHEAPSGQSDDGESSMSLTELISEETAMPTANFVDLAAAIYSDPWVMGLIDRGVKSKLTTDTQRAVWNAVRSDPSIIQVKPKSIGVSGRALARAVSKETGTEYNGKSSDVVAAKVFKTKILPAMQDALSDDNVSQRLVKNRQILDVIKESTRRKNPTREKIRNIRFEGDKPSPERGPASHGPWEYPPDIYGDMDPPASKEDYLKPFMEAARQKHEERKKELARKIKNPTLRRMLASSSVDTPSSVRVASRFLLKNGAWRMPPAMAKIYKKLHDYGMDNLETFMKGNGHLDTDRMALALAREARHPDWADDPTHWVYEISYDLERAAQRL
jgi:hypothetical protein